MQKTIITLLINILLNITYTYAQTAPLHLKYFGFALVDCGLDDPNDAIVKNNYSADVAPFCNIMHMCVNSPLDTIVTRVDACNNLCMKPVISIQDIFYFIADTNAPSGKNYDLYPDFFNRWNIFKSVNTTLNVSKVEALYVFDEPVWNGVSFQELDTVCKLIKNDLPTISLLIVEAWPVINNLQVPASIDWLAFDQYGVFDVSTDTAYLNKLAITKSKRSAAHQKMFLIMDAQFAPWYSPTYAWQSDTMLHVVQNYYNLAASDTTIIGITGFTWPGIEQGWLGAQSLPQTVINKIMGIGQQIKANYNPCLSTNIRNDELNISDINVFPNPSSDIISIEFKDNNQTETGLELYNLLGKTIYKNSLSPTDTLFNIDISGISNGCYLLKLINSNGIFFKKIIVQ